MTHISDTSEDGREAASANLLLDEIRPYPFLVFLGIEPARRGPARGCASRGRRRCRVRVGGAFARGGVIAGAGRLRCSVSVSGIRNALDGHVRPVECARLRSRACLSASGECAEMDGRSLCRRRLDARGDRRGELGGRADRAGVRTRQDPGRGTAGGKMALPRVERQRLWSARLASRLCDRVSSRPSFDTRSHFRSFFPLCSRDHPSAYHLSATVRSFARRTFRIALRNALAHRASTPKHLPSSQGRTKASYPFAQYPSPLFSLQLIQGGERHAEPDVSQGAHPLRRIADHAFRSGISLPGFCDSHAGTLSVRATKPLMRDARTRACVAGNGP